jgi:hypothetical protein
VDVEKAKSLSKTSGAESTKLAEQIAAEIATLRDFLKDPKLPAALVTQYKTEVDTAETDASDPQVTTDGLKSILARLQQMESTIIVLLNVGTTSQSSTTPAAPDKLLITNALGAGGTEVTTQSITVNTSRTYYAALVDASGTFKRNVQAIWVLSNNAFPMTNVNPWPTPSQSITFTPSMLGTTLVQAYFVDDSKISDITGMITVTSDNVAASLNKISGDAQTATAGASPASSLRVRVLDSFNTGFAGANVTFSVVSGGGSISGSSTVATDANGYAQTTVTLGNTAGANVFRATVASTSLTQDFTATGTAGAAASIAYTVQPSGGREFHAFTAQPVVAVTDALGNTVTSAAGTVTLSRQSGTGALTGTLTATLSGGVATFTNVGYNKAESGLVIRATYSAMTADTASLTVAAVPGKCQMQTGVFSTRNGGCYDASTGLTWSALSSSSMSWHDAVWDTSLGGNASTQDAGDYSRTNDYPAMTKSCVGNCDNSTVNHCHDLNEGGQTDWRTPSLADLTSVRTSSLSEGGALNFLNGAANQNLWAADTDTGTTANGLQLNLSGGSSSADKLTTAKVYCVRGNRANASYLSVTSAPGTVTLNTVSQPFTLQVMDALNNPVNMQGQVMSMTTSLGTFGGTITGLTSNRDGQAVISGWTLGTPGNASITFSSSGFASVIQTVFVGGTSGHTCKFNDANFATADGGCKHLATGLVWSRASSGSWYAAVWDSSLSGNAQPDVFDGGRLHDYDVVTMCDGAGGRSAGCDNVGSGSGVNETGNYCHSLVEGGKSDWRMPTYAELISVSGSTKAGNYFDSGVSFGGLVGSYYWSTLPNGSTAAWRVVLTMYNSPATDYKYNPAGIVCVRP